MNILSIFKRAFTGNLGRITVTGAEQAKLEAQGIKDPTVQRYMMWRSAMLLMVVIAIIASTGLATYTDLTDTGEEPNVLGALTEKIMDSVNGAVPESAADAVEAAKEKIDEKTAEKSDDEATAGNETAEDEETEAEPNAFEKFVDILQAAPLYVLLITALMAFLYRNRPRVSVRFLIGGFAFGFVVPIAIALCPWSWFGYVGEDVSPMKDPTKFLGEAAKGAVDALTMLGTLLPLVLALIPGVLKGCMRVKTLLPASTLPGWFIVMAAPLYGLFLLAVFVAINQVTNDPLLVGGVLMLVLAHLVYAFRAPTFTQPLLVDEDYERMKKSQMIVMLCTLIAAGLVVTYLTTRSFMGAHILGMNPKTAFMTPFSLVEMGVEIISRAMFVGVLAVDVFMRINHAAWNDIKRLAQSSSSGSYQNTMEAMDEVLK